MGDIRTQPPSVVIVAYHGDVWIPRCLATLKEASRSRVRLVLVDNAGNTCLDALNLAGFDAVVLRCDRPLGFAEANNFALGHVDFAASKAVCFLNQDTLSEAGWLDECVAVLRASPTVGAVTPRIATFDWTGWDTAFLECARRSEGFRRAMDSGLPLERVYQVPEITAAAMVVRSDALLKAGPFDPVFGSYYEDYDLCRRIREAGYTLGVCAKARVAHYSGSATSTEAAKRRRMRQILRNRVIHRLRCAGPRRVRSLLEYLSLRFPYNLGRSLFGTPSSQPLRVFLAAHWDLLLLLRRLVSNRQDGKAWMEYLFRLGWPDSDQRSHRSYNHSEALRSNEKV